MNSSELSLSGMGGGSTQKPCLDEIDCHVLLVAVVAVSEATSRPGRAAAVGLLSGEEQYTGRNCASRVGRVQVQAGVRAG